MRTYKRKTDRGLKPKDIYEKAALILDEDKTKSIRSVAKYFDLSHQTLTRYLQRRKAAIVSGTSIDNIGVGYSKTRQVFTDDQERVLANCLVKSYQVNDELTGKDVRQFAYSCACKYNIRIPQTWHVNKEAGREWQGAFLKRHPEVIVQQESNHPFPELRENTEYAVYDDFDAGPSGFSSTQQRVWILPEEEAPFPNLVPRIKDVISLKNPSAKTQTKKIKISTESDDDYDDEGDDYFCMNCGGTFEQSHVGEEWLQCTACNKWAHMNCCTTSDSTSYVCINCESDYSD